MQLPLADRPRERLEMHGPAVLSSIELIAIIIGSGTQGTPVLALAETLLTHFCGLDGLRAASLHELTQIRGLGKAGALRLKAAFALSTRLQPPSRPHITSPQTAAAHLETLKNAGAEHLAILLRDIKGRLIRQETIAIGTLSEVLIHPREILRPAISHGASSYIIAHNHPSGDPTPSTADMTLTKQLIEASTLLAIPLDDHLIVTPSRTFSLYEEGYFHKRNSY